MWDQILITHHQKIPKDIGYYIERLHLGMNLRLRDPVCLLLLDLTQVSPWVKHWALTRIKLWVKAWDQTRIKLWVKAWDLNLMLRPLPLGTPLPNDA